MDFVIPVCAKYLDNKILTAKSSDAHVFNILNVVVFCILSYFVCHTRLQLLYQIRSVGGQKMPRGLSYT